MRINWKIHAMIESIVILEIDMQSLTLAISTQQTFRTVSPFSLPPKKFRTESWPIDNKVSCENSTSFGCQFWKFLVGFLVVSTPRHHITLWWILSSNTYRRTLAAPPAPTYPVSPSYCSTKTKMTIQRCKSKCTVVLQSLHTHRGDIVANPDS